MMLGKPIIVAKNTGMDKIVEEENMGMIVEYGNKDMLMNNINELITNKDLYKNLSKNAKNAYGKYNWKTMEERLLELYKDLN